MSVVGDNTDVTLQLPDEVLCHVLSFLRLKDKLQSEAVNRKFQRCVIKELKAKPQPLDLDLRNKKLNGFFVQKKEEENWKQRMFGAIQTLAKKAKFSGIWVQFGQGTAGPESLETVGRILSLLVSEKQCLAKVTAFESDSSCSQAVMLNFLDNCDKLSTIKFMFFVNPLDGEPISPGFNGFPLDLGPLFKNKSVVELELKLFRYHQEGLVDMFQGIKPNTLRKLDLEFCRGMPGLNMAELFTAMRTNASALAEIHLHFSNIDLQLTDLFESLAQLPVLRKCDISFYAVPLGDQFVAAMTSLFRMSDINITMRCVGNGDFADASGCQMVNMIRQIQGVHQGLVVDFVPQPTMGQEMILSVGNASFKKEFYSWIQHCGAEDCFQCQSFYPSLVDLLRYQARSVARIHFEEAQHLPNCFLDRCRIDQCLAELKSNVPYGRMQAFVCRS